MRGFEFCYNNNNNNNNNNKQRRAKPPVRLVRGTCGRRYHRVMEGRMIGAAMKAARLPLVIGGFRHRRHVCLR